MGSDVGVQETIMAFQSIDNEALENFAYKSGWRE
jgi:hypothetical protein